MTKKVVLVGHCGADCAYLRIAVSGACKNASVVSVDEESELSEALAKGASLVLVNRQLDYGYPTYEGIELIKLLRTAHPEVKLMLVSNYDDAQESAIRAGALPGFGKSEIGTDKVKVLLRNALVAD